MVFLTVQHLLPTKRHPVQLAATASRGSQPSPTCWRGKSARPAGSPRCWWSRPRGSWPFRSRKSRISGLLSGGRLEFYDVLWFLHPVYPMFFHKENGQKDKWTCRAINFLEPSTDWLVLVLLSYFWVLFSPDMKNENTSILLTTDFYVKHVQMGLYCLNLTILDMKYHDVENGLEVGKAEFFRDKTGMLAGWR